MDATRTLFRLLRVRQLEEEHLKIALESVLAELGRLSEAQRAVIERERRGRQLVLESIRKGELQSRLAGLEEVRTARQLHAALSGEIQTSEQEAGVLRSHFNAKRMQRCQVETLVEAAKAGSELQASRRAQEALDEGHRSRMLSTAGTQPLTYSTFDTRHNCAKDTKPSLLSSESVSQF